ncbi:hypothetical protein OC842_007198 [Tilletia horrida]|uniref:Uncharacterized protein n=1 Tax=Tilletia horrida TaxID=155126 RepID=A0AAN6G4U7_9BASI|nr:hypothetical protein OC842_007198 [Tilletia horrida]
MMTFADAVKVAKSALNQLSLLATSVEAAQVFVIVAFLLGEHDRKPIFFRVAAIVVAFAVLNEELAGTYSAIITVDEACFLFGLLSWWSLAFRSVVTVALAATAVLIKADIDVVTIWAIVKAQSSALEAGARIIRRALKEAQAELRALAGRQAPFADVAATKPPLKVDELAK